ncbi:TPA: minor capsid protein [Klebsiella oxytoca]|nr:minor capsid protein [Klebsiella oxytoca]
MILFPMTQEQKSKVGTPIIPRSKVDPTQSARPVSNMFQDIEGRYLNIKRRLKALFDQRLTGLQREANAHQSWMMCNNEGSDPSLYQVNAGKFIYDMTAAELADLLQVVQSILDDELLDGGNQNLWAMDYVIAEYDRGTLNAFTNLSVQSQVYASQTTLQQLLSSPGHLNQVAAAKLTTFSDWKVISDIARGDLTNIITDAVARGVNPRETASVISKRLDVSMSKAKTIAQTEQVGALRQAQWNETDWAADRLGLNTGLLWLSALKPTTRAWHRARHGKVYTTEEVRDFYAENGNRYNCYCSQIPVLLNDNGRIFNEGLADKLDKERDKWHPDETN